MHALFEKIRAACDQPLSQSTTLPREAYRSAEFHEWERQELLGGGWMAVAHVSQIPLAGDFITLDLLDEPLVVVRGKDQVIRVLSRVCPHRAMDILPPGHAEGRLTTAEPRGGLPDSYGRTRFFLCPYHSWTFDLDGQLRACPEMQQAEYFHKEEIGLHEFRCEIWNGFVFAAQQEIFTVTPEFGPDGYLHVDPRTGVPMADLRQLNRRMGKILKAEIEKSV